MCRSRPRVSGPSVVAALLSALASGLSAQVSPPENLLPNPSFESGAAGTVSEWSSRRWGGQPSFAVDHGVARSGKRSVRIGSVEGADASWSHTLEVRPGSRYRLSVWVKTKGLARGTGRGAQLNLHELQKVGRSEALTGDHDWTRLVTEFDSGERSQLTVNLLFGGWGRSTGAAWFDDVELVELTAPLPRLSAAEAAAWYRERVHPILEDHCYRCHGPRSKRKGGLFLGSREGLFEGGESGAAVFRERPLASLLLRAVRHEGPEMPPKRKLDPAQIDTLATWVRLGVPFDPDLVSEAPATTDANGPPRVDARTKRHWAFQAVRRPDVPPSRYDHPVDRFVGAKLAEIDAELAPEAPRPVLIRRLYHDVLGLPPTPEQVRAFVGDARPDAWDRLVDRVLASPHYGERQARHWLDVVRYAETNSFERDNLKPHVWRYRDYVIRAFQNDKPFDRFLLEQLAGDELEPESDAVDAEALIATGYYRLGQWDDEPADPELAYYDELDDIVGTTSQAMLGLTMNCARCHNHKLDPIPQRDYYRFLAFFRNVERYGVRSTESVEKASVRVIMTAANRDRHDAIVKRHEASVAQLDQKLEEIAARAKPAFISVDHEEWAYPRRRVGILRKYVGKGITAADVKRYEQSFRKVQHLRRRGPRGFDSALCVSEVGPKPRATRVLARGNPHAPGDSVAPGFPSIFGLPDPDVRAPRHGRSTGRRLALAEWITDPRHPLTARVFVNRLWQSHFGRGLVRTPNNFGLRGSRPTHPELLDWLAAEFVAGGFKVKRMHRLLLRCATYRQSYRADQRLEGIDPENDRFWRFDLRRMSAEEVRDSILAVTGSLDRTRFGPSIYPLVPSEVLAGQSRPGEGWHTSPPHKRDRRSIYVHIKRSLALPILAAFDAAGTELSCPVRFQTTQPTQALTLLNGDFVGRQANRFAALLERELPGDPYLQVQSALWRTMQRRPTPAETWRGVDFMEQLARRHGYGRRRALERFCLAALNLNEFLYLR